MKKYTLLLVLFTIFSLFTCDLASARSKTMGLHNHNEKRCYKTATGKHIPVSYDRTFIDKLIKHNKKAIKEAQDIVNRADREELKTIAQEIITEHQEDMEKLQTLRTKWFEN
ncbi:MAG TPA: DUF305 domain-containing protein [Candidatus Gastranaerophilales bacterium]|nr:DUF305 domain-containing protein [Candidatus Gastranaerophilales bacterium]